MKNKNNYIRFSAFMIVMVLTFSNGLLSVAEEVEVVTEEPAVVREAESVSQAEEPVPVEPAPAPVVEEVPEAAPVEVPAEAPEQVQTFEPEVPASVETAETPASTVEPTVEPVAEPEEPAQTSEAVTTAADESTEDNTEAEEHDTTESAPAGPVETAPATEEEETVAFTGKAKIELKDKYETLYFDEETILKVDVNYANKEYTLRWETRIIERPWDDPDWAKINKDEKYEFEKETQWMGAKSFEIEKHLKVKLDDTDPKREYRIVLTDVETGEEFESEIYRFPMIQEKPEEETEETVETEEADVDVPEVTEDTEEVAEAEDFIAEDTIEESFEAGQEENTEENSEDMSVGSEDEALEEEILGAEPEELGSEEASERKIEVIAEWEKETPAFDSSITFTAVLYGYEGILYQIQWQHSKDAKTWEDIPGAIGETYTVTATEENCKDYWRAAVILIEG